MLRNIFTGKCIKALSKALESTTQQLWGLPQWGGIFPAAWVHYGGRPGSWWELRCCHVLLTTTATRDSLCLRKWCRSQPGPQGTPGGMCALSQPRQPEASQEREYTWSFSKPYTRHFLSISCLHSGNNKHNLISLLPATRLGDQGEVSMDLIFPRFCLYKMTLHRLEEHDAGAHPGGHADEASRQHPLQ